MRTQRRSALSSLVGMFLLVIVAREAAAHPPHARPEGFDQFAVFMATGAFDPTSPNPDPAITGCFFMFCDPAYFQEEIMGWTAAEIVAEEAAAKLFFLERFGLDVDALIAEGRVDYIPFSIDPRIDYRMVHLAGRRVPSEGWPVRDGGFLVVATDPAGIPLGGEQAGETMPAGASVVYGYYNVLTRRPNGRPGREIVIHYTSPRPSLPVDGPVGFICDAEVDGLPTGRAQGVISREPLPDGRIVFSVRNVLTFPGLGHGL